MTERLEFKAAFTSDEAGEITGKAWDFNSPDRVGDVIEPSALAGMVGKTFPLLFAHDQAQVLGPITIESFADNALNVVGKMLVDDVARAREVRSLVKSGAITGLSIGFITRKAMPRKGGGRTIQSLDLAEISLVAVPAHNGARITNVKDLTLTAAIETKSIEDLAIELKAANDNIALVTKRLETAETALARPNIITDKKPDEVSLERKAFGSFLRHGAERMPAEETKALIVSDDTRGGYLAPAEFQTEILKNLVEISPVRQAARVGSTGAGSVILPKRTGTPTASWVGETETRTGTESSYGQVEIPIHEMAAWVDVSVQLLEDAAVNVEAEVASDLAEEFARLEGSSFVLGNGFKKPDGFMTATGIAEIVTGSAATIADADGQANGLINAFYSLPMQYRARAVWMMNSTTLGSARKLKTSDKQYLWQPGIQAGEPSTILGRPVIEVPDMPDEGAGAFPIVLGDFNAAYRIYDRVGMSILRDPYTQATTGKVRFHARRRVGGATVMVEALRKIKCATS